MSEQTIPEKKPDNFEDGKELEDYVQDLEKVAGMIEPEPFPDATARIEDVATPPIRNEKKKPQPKPEPPKQAAPPQQAPAKAEAPPPPPTPTVAQQAPVQSKPDASVATTPSNPQAKPAEQPTPQPPAQQPQPQAFKGIDDYIERSAQAAAQNAYRQVKEVSYGNIFAVINGQAQIVPITQQPQPAPEVKRPEQTKPEPEVQTPPQLSVAQQIEQINIGLKDPSLPPNMKKALLKKKCELWGVDFEDAPVIVEQAPAPKSSPVETKKVNDGKKPQKKWSLKAAVALVAIAVFAGAAIYVIVGALIH